eukprot:CAMPEP_0119152710 /NCGR_PEP_ID=MMETSP1310-20130426/48209_1 /TAXON_ID=464262 /ORGANISM="Genus nov. species nov., Strain RCC2339" /LENGTH=374 /DNA_ID=CAMNT_0007145103 /DNA_START=29 /DNA_END=1150 /DNA_ORIENTATION=+
MELGGVGGKIGKVWAGSDNLNSLPGYLSLLCRVKHQISLYRALLNLVDRLERDGTGKLVALPTNVLEATTEFFRTAEARLNAGVAGLRVVSLGLVKRYGGQAGILSGEMTLEAVSGDSSRDTNVIEDEDDERFCAFLESQQVPPEDSLLGEAEDVGDSYLLLSKSRARHRIMDILLETSEDLRVHETRKREEAQAAPSKKTASQSSGEALEKRLSVDLSKHTFRRHPRFNKFVSSLLIAWLTTNRTWPYPSRTEKLRLSKETGLSVKQISTWMDNARRRLSLVSKNRKRRMARAPRASSVPSAGTMLDPCTELMDEQTSSSDGSGQEDDIDKVEHDAERMGACADHGGGSRALGGYGPKLLAGLDAAGSKHERT